MEEIIKLGSQESLDFVKKFFEKAKVAVEIVVSKDNSVTVSPANPKEQ